MLSESVIRKANQIVINLALDEPEQVARATAAHMRSYWPPNERGELFRLVDESDPRLDRAVVEAAALLRDS